MKMFRSLQSIKGQYSRVHPVLDLSRRCKTAFLRRYTQTHLRQLMRHVPSPGDMVNDSLVTRGITCSSFTSVSLNPELISFCIKTPSTTFDLIKQRKMFAVHVLSKNQIQVSLQFSSPATAGDFTTVMHTFDQDYPHIPQISGCLGILNCNLHDAVPIGDHYVLFGQVQGTILSPDTQIKPLIYYQSSYHGIGDEVFINAFEHATLPYDEWTHIAHLRMGWIYLRESENDQDEFTKARDGIQRYNEANLQHVRHGFNETITRFFLRLIKLALLRDSQNTSSFQESVDFFQFLGRYPSLTKFDIIFKFYTPELLYSQEAQRGFAPPDLTSLPSTSEEVDFLTKIP